MVIFKNFKEKKTNERDQSGHCCIALVNYSRMLATMNEKARENMSLPSATGG
jgi:hypothetical protein